MKQIVSSILVAGVLLTVLFNTNDSLTRIIVLPFLVFAVALGLKNALIIMKKEKLKGETIMTTWKCSHVHSSTIHTKQILT